MLFPWLRSALGAGQDLKGFDVDNPYGHGALGRILEDICNQHTSTQGVKACLYTLQTSSTSFKPPSSFLRRSTGLSTRCRPASQACSFCHADQMQIHFSRLRARCRAVK